MNSKKVRTFSIAFLLASIILFASAAVYTSYMFLNLGKISGSLEDPLEAWSEASYIIWPVNSTHYASRNMSTNLVEWVISNLTEVWENSRDALPNGGRIHFKAGTYSYATTLVVNGHNFTVTGEGTRNTILMYTGTFNPAFKIEGVAGSWLSGITLLDFTIMGDSIQHNGVYGLHIKHATNPLTVLRVRIMKMGDFGLYLSGGVYTGGLNELILVENRGDIKLASADGYSPNSNSFNHLYISRGDGTFNISTSISVEDNSEGNTFYYLHLENIHVTDSLFLVKDSALYTQFLYTEIMDITFSTAVVFRLNGSSKATRIIGGSFGHDTAGNAVISIEDSSDYNYASSFYLVGNSLYASNIPSSGTHNTIKDILRSGGWVRNMTERSGYSAGASGFAIQHYLAGTPKTVLLAPVGSGGAITFTYTANSTHVVIYHSGGGGQGFSWFFKVNDTN